MGRRRAVVLSAPILLVGTMYLTFKWMGVLFGPKVGYFLGFLVYWFGWCLLFPLWAIRFEGIREAFAPARSRLGKPSWVGRALLWIPPASGYILAFPRVVAKATPLIVLSSVALAVVNGIAEELLWRGTFSRVFPRHPLLGYVYPALGFGLWHICPQVLYPSTYPGGVYSFVAVSIVYGFLFGWIPYRTGSIRESTLSHVLFDFSGLGGLRYFG